MISTILSEKSKIKHRCVSILARVPLVGAADSFLRPNPFIAVLVKYVKRVEQKKVSSKVVNRKTTLGNQLKTGQTQRFGGPLQTHWPKLSLRGTVINRLEVARLVDGL